MGGSIPIAGAKGDFAQAIGFQTQRNERGVTAELSGTNYNTGTDCRGQAIRGVIDVLDRVQSDELPDSVVR